MPEKVTAEQVMEAVNEMQGAVKKYGEDSAEAKEMIAKTQGILDRQEDQNQENVKKFMEAEKARLELEDQVKDLELSVAKIGTMPGVDYKQSDEYKTLQKFIQYGEKGLTVDEIKTLRTDDDTAGGYRVVNEMDDMVIKKITEISNLRAVARVKTVGKKTLEIVKRETIPSATYEGETAAGSDSEPSYGNETLTCYRLTTTVPFTMDQLMDDTFDLEADINADVAEAMAQREGNRFVLGTGAKQPEGFLTNADVLANFRESSTSGVIDPEDIILMTGDLKTGYNPAFGLNRKTLANIRSKVSTTGEFIWQPGLNGPAMNTLGGDPYVLLPDMPDIAAGAYPVIYADFLRGYTITDRTGMVVIRDDYSKKRQAIVELTFHKWNTGQVVLSEAFVPLKIKA